jgi:GntR family transcriptional regulator / MocR family aminotransferase
MMPYSKQTLYMKLYEQFKKMINDNKYKAHEKLPSKRKLADSLKISPLTVQAAYDQLIAEGYIYAIEKSGYYVSKKVDVMPLITQKRKPENQEISTEDTYTYEFKTNIIDTSFFPSSTWAKLTRDVLAENHHETLNVTDPKGILKLREEITRYIEVYRGIQVDPSQIIIGSGGSQLMSIVIDILGRKEPYAIENPNYPKIYHLLKGNDVKVSLIPLDASGLSIQSLEQSSACIVHVTPSHQFPTGIVMPIHRRNELLNWANQSDKRYIIEDDYDSEFRYQGKPIPALQSLDQNDKVIYINTFTKTLAPAFRIAYMVLPKKLLPKYQSLILYHGCTVPNLEQLIMYRFMHEGYFERHINRMRNHYRHKLDILKDVIDMYPDALMIGQEAGLHFLLMVKKQVLESDWIEKARQHHIFVTGVSQYDHVRDFNHTEFPTLIIGYSGMPTDDLENAMHTLLGAIGLQKHEKS